MAPLPAPVAAAAWLAGAGTVAAGAGAGALGGAMGCAACVVGAEDAPPLGGAWTSGVLWDDFDSWCAACLPFVWVAAGAGVLDPAALEGFPSLAAGAGVAAGVVVAAQQASASAGCCASADPL
ncbi:MAG TPA: hypothetical protein VKG82_05345 [Solirubrobacteraceae bacterium]|nr:hypothetical protein [Solirubrobacteraceae bacterium]